MAASRERARKRVSSGVTDTPAGTTGLSAVTVPSRHIDNIEEFSTERTVLGPQNQPIRLWRWYERLDGSSDLYCDEIGVGSKHVARLVRNGAGFQLAKPADLTVETWTTRSAAHHVVRKMLGQAQTDEIAK
jgi:hypothetical protein